MKLVEIGKTAEGRTMVMAIITSPENHKKLDRYKEIARRLATAEGLSDEQARALATEGKAVVWIDGGLHATEVLGAQQLMELVYQMVSLSDPETLRFLKDVILLATPVNPDGLDLVSSWYCPNRIR
jgi:murein tripeptide amidase MpaA